MPGKWARKVLISIFGLVAVLTAGVWVGVWLAPGTPPVRGTATPVAARAAPAAENTLKYHAMVIGISEYASLQGEGWGCLQTAQMDAEAIAAVLENQYGFEVSKLINGQASKSGILSAFDRLAAMTDNDAVLIYYAGHGYYDPDLDEGFWIPCDAKRTAAGRDAKEDWIWNSMITKLVNASRARHILLVADSCYSGSLFRGGESLAQKRALVWYAKALGKPSRFLVTSGDVEPVLDSGFQHSIFAEALLQFLNHPDQPVFSASDLAMSVRQKVSALTGQMVRMGPLAVSAHGGGEFVFNAGAELLVPASATALEVASGQMRSLAQAQAQENIPALPAPPTDFQAARDALWLGKAGLTNTAALVLAESIKSSAAPVSKTVAEYFGAGQPQRQQTALQQLLDQVKAMGANASATNRVERMLPRIVTCLGPDAAAPGIENEVTAKLIRICLTSALQEQARVVTVDRENMETLFQELNLGISDLADQRAQLKIGSFLPASMLLTGHVIKQQAQWVVLLRLVDTETSKILKTWTIQVDEQADLNAACREIAGLVAKEAVALRPLQAPVRKLADGTWQIPLGSFHGLVQDAALDVIRMPRPSAKPVEVGTAEVLVVGNENSEIRMILSPGQPPAEDHEELWACEQALH